MDATAETRLGAAVKRLIDRGDRSVDGVAEAAGVARSTVYRWMQGDAPTIGVFARLLEAFPAADDQAELLAALAGGAQVRVEPVTPALELDFNGDGQIDLDDPLEASAEACERLAAMMRGLVSRTCRKRMTPDEGEALMSECAHIERRVAKARVIVSLLVVTPKRCAKPLPAAGGA